MFGYQKSKQELSSDAAYHVSKLIFDDVEVIIPQEEVVSIESIHELQSLDKNKKTIGKIVKREINVPVYCLSDSMDILTDIPEGRSKCVVIRHDDGDFSILCKDIQNLVLRDMRLQTVPSCMNNSGMPLTHLCLYKEVDNLLKFGLVSNADCLSEYIKVI